jgi:hypothetical protein
MSDATLLLDAAAAAAQLLPLVYDELRRRAAARMAQESPDHTLQPTALVHEAYQRRYQLKHRHGQWLRMLARLEKLDFEKQALEAWTRDRSRGRAPAGPFQRFRGHVTQLRSIIDYGVPGIRCPQPRPTIEYGVRGVRKSLVWSCQCVADRRPLIIDAWAQPPLATLPCGRDA